ncbi:Ig-like domain-containing protein [Streptacidiphilus sp. N1-12]|uniref:Ig-like domain-containing protein n=2 Tax=Streptacidiphilus alkalitolerans TaxID=3342712 RepID=A0ABV6VFZ0_9ACTN
MDAVTRQRRLNARRIARATAVTAAAVVLGGGVAHADAGTALRARDRADAVSGSPATVDLLAGRLPADRALVALTATPAHGRVVLNDDVTATYTSVPGFAGTDSFSYRFTDDRGGTARVTVAVTVSHGTEPVSAYAA